MGLPPIETTEGSIIFSLRSSIFIANHTLLMRRIRTI